MRHELFEPSVAAITQIGAYEEPLSAGAAHVMEDNA
jgi:hypothetical protein